MATASTLEEAAAQSFDNLFTIWLAATAFKSKLVAFAATVLPLFPDQDPNGRPVANWATIMASFANQLDTDVAPIRQPYTTLNTAADYLYRLCWMGFQLETQNLITTAQANAVLAAYNADF